MGSGDRLGSDFAEVFGSAEVNVHSITCGWQRHVFEAAAKDNWMTIFITLITAVWALTAVCALIMKDK